MNLRDLRYLLAIAEHGHFGRAAEACHVTQPTLSGQVRRLEDYLGVAVFERQTRGVVPTEVGRRILDHARRALAHADAIEAEARAARDPFTGPLRLGVIPTLGPYLMPLVFAPLGARYPMLAVELWEDVTTSLVDRLREGRLEAVLLATEAPGADLTSVALFDEIFVAVLPRGHQLASRMNLVADDLAPDMLVLADPHCLREQALAACGRRDSHASAVRASSLETLVNMVAAGYGTTLVPALAARAMAARDVLVRHFHDGPSRTVRLVSRRSFGRSRALEALAEVIRLAVRAAEDEEECHDDSLPQPSSPAERSWPAAPDIGPSPPGPVLRRLGSRQLAETGGNHPSPRRVTSARVLETAMASNKTGKNAAPKVRIEHPDPDVASRKPAKSEDRPGFDLGGAKDRTGAGGLRNPKGSIAGGSGNTGRATGASDPSGSRSLGNAGEPGSASGSGPTDGSDGPS